MQTYISRCGFLIYVPEEDFISMLVCSMGEAAPEVWSFLLFSRRVALLRHRARSTTVKPPCHLSPFDRTHLSNACRNQTLCNQRMFPPCPSSSLFCNLAIHHHVPSIGRAVTSANDVVLGIRCSMTGTHTPLKDTKSQNLLALSLPFLFRFLRPATKSIQGL